MDVLSEWLLPVLRGGAGNLAAYLAAHVLLCLLPAFFIAGAMSALIPQQTITRFLGRNSPRHVSYPAAAAAGSLLAVCSCTIVPLFAGIYKKGAGLGPAITFLFFAPAANILALVYTGGVIGVDLAAGGVFLGDRFHIRDRHRRQVFGRRSRRLGLQPAIGLHRRRSRLGIRGGRRRIEILALVRELVLERHFGMAHRGRRFVGEHGRRRLCGRSLARRRRHEAVIVERKVRVEGVRIGILAAQGCGEGRADRCVHVEVEILGQLLQLAVVVKPVP